MRLLKLGNHDDARLTTNLINSIPPYAILSHTWGADRDEVTFSELRDGSGQTKTGYRKITFCGRQARKDGLHHFWVDTCCIDKANHTELSEAIASMYRWYHDAAKCYVYLSDVSTCTDQGLAKREWKANFRKSKWFTRGWTLQELIAPTVVEFFSKEGEYLGDKHTLEQSIHEITAIPVDVLRGHPLSRFPVAERLRWAEKRSTTRKEDKAYCLLGIFNVYIPLIYGEGDNAYTRLKEEINKSSRTSQNRPENEYDLLRRSALATLARVGDAAFDSYENQRHRRCLPDTRVDLLQEIMHWATSDSKPYIFWLKGRAGTGKSTIALTIAHLLEERRISMASFFFKRGGGDLARSRKVISTVAFQPAQQSPLLQEFIWDALQENADLGSSASLSRQYHKLLLGPLLRLQASATSAQSFVVVLDALDECDDSSDVRLLLRLFGDSAHVELTSLRFLITSRPESPVRLGFQDVSHIIYHELALHNLPRNAVNRDIKVFITHELAQIEADRGLSEG